MKFGVFKSINDGLFVCQIFETYEEIKSDYLLNSMYAKYGESILPLRVNQRGGWCTISNDDKPVRIIESDTWPKLSLEEVFPKNNDKFRYGWVSPECDTYSCEYMEHAECASKICEAFGYPSIIDGRINAPDDILIQKGWAKIMPRQKCYYSDRNVNDAVVKWLDERGYRKNFV